LDSIDVSTPERANRNGSIPDATMQQREFATPYGEDSTTVRAQFASAILTSINYLLSEKVNERKLDEVYHEQTELGTIEEVIQETDVRSRHDLSFPVTETDTSMDSQATTLNSFGES
jgi:hypothetical protein